MPPIVGCALPAVHVLAAPAAGARGTASPNSLRSRGARSKAAGLKHVSLFCSRFPAGFSHLPNGLYPSYIPLSHLEPPSAGSPLLAQLGQHSLFESQKGEWGPAWPCPRPPRGAQHLWDRGCRGESCAPWGYRQGIFLGF